MRIKSQKSPAMTTSQVRRGLVRACMKNSTTSVALKTAIAERGQRVQRAQIEIRDLPREIRAGQQHEQRRRSTARAGCGVLSGHAALSGRAAETGISRRCQRSASRARRFRRAEIGCSSVAVVGPDEHPGHQPHADDHVQRVQAGHQEVKRKEYLRLPRKARPRTRSPGPGTRCS